MSLFLCYEISYGHAMAKWGHAMACPYYHVLTL